MIRIQHPNFFGVAVLLLAVGIIQYVESKNINRHFLCSSRDIRQTAYHLCTIHKRSQAKSKSLQPHNDLPNGRKASTESEQRSESHLNTDNEICNIDNLKMAKYTTPRCKEKILTLIKLLSKGENTSGYSSSQRILNTAQYYVGLRNDEVPKYNMLKKLEEFKPSPPVRSVRDYCCLHGCSSQNLLGLCQ